MEIIANLTSYSKDLICRICMQNSDNLFPIFHEVFLDDDTVTIADIITECTKYPVTHTDHLPAQICNPCIKAARCAYQFKKQTEAAFCHLKALYYVTWIPEEEKDNSVSVGVLCRDKCTQTKRTTVFRCEMCPKKFFVRNELRKHRITSHIYDGKICRVCGVNFTHLGQLKIHLSIDHPSDGILCDFKCNVCSIIFTHMDVLKRHLNRMHKVENELLTTPKISFDEPEIQNHTELVPSLNDYSSHRPVFQEEEDNEQIAIESQNSDTDIDTIPENEEVDDHSFSNLTEEYVEQLEETVASPVILIKVEKSDYNSNILNNNNNNHFIEETKNNVFELQEEKSDHKIGTGDNNDESDPNNYIFEYHNSNSRTSEDDIDDDYDHDSDDKVNNEPTRGTTKTSIKQKKPNSQNKNLTNSISRTNNTIPTPARRRRGSFKNEENRCKICNRTFTRYNHLRLHMWTHSDEKPHVCNFCGRGFSRSDRLRKHVQNIHFENSYKCDQCLSTYARNRDLQHHIRVKHKEDSSARKRTFDCDMCDKKFSKKLYLLKHKPLHTDRPYVCRHCLETFREKEQMKEHQEKEHDMSRNFLCNVCGASFDRSYNLKIHLRSHMGEKPHKCRFCEKRFTRTTELKSHERYHIGYKPHICNLCGKSFCQRYILIMHMRTHTGEKPYKCKQCHKAFTQGNDLKSHMRRHTGERFCCDMCNAAFLQRYTLTTHLKKVHGVVVATIPRRVRKINQSIDVQQLPTPSPPPPKQ